MGRGMFHSQVDKTGWRPKYTLKEMAPVTSAVCPEEERAGWSVWESSRAGLRKRKATQCLWPRMAELRSTRRVWRRQISGCLKEQLPDHDSWQLSGGLPGFPVLGPWRHLQWGGCRGISYVLEGERPGDSGGSWWQVMPQWPPYVPVWERICPETLSIRTHAESWRGVRKMAFKPAFPQRSPSSLLLSLSASQYTHLRLAPLGPSLDAEVDFPFLSPLSCC